MANIKPGDYVVFNKPIPCSTYSLFLVKEIVDNPEDEYEFGGALNAVCLNVLTQDPFYLNEFNLKDLKICPKEEAIELLKKQMAYHSKLLNQLQEQLETVCALEND